MLLASWASHPPHRSARRPRRGNEPPPAPCGTPPSPRKRVSPVDFLISVAFIGYGLWSLLSPHPSRPRTTFGTAWAILLLVFGALSILLKFLASTINAPKVPTTPQESAQSLHNLHKAIYGQEQEYRPADSRNYPDLDFAFYERAFREFEAEHFRWVGDIENVTANRAAPLMRTMLRV